MSFVHDLCERTVVLNFGRLIYEGPTRRRAGRRRGARGLSWQPTGCESKERTLLLEVDNLDVRYGRTHAVKGVSLTVDRRRTGGGARRQRRRQDFAAARAAGAGSGGRRTHPFRRRRHHAPVAAAAPAPAPRAGARGSADRARSVGARKPADGHLLPHRRRGRSHDIDAIYDRFPNLAARRKMPASVLSGGEQQMLAIGRAHAGQAEIDDAR